MLAEAPWVKALVIMLRARAGATVVVWGNHWRGEGTVQEVLLKPLLVLLLLMSVDSITIPMAVRTRTVT